MPKENRWPDDPEHALAEMKDKLRSIRKLKSGIENKESELYRFLHEEEEKLLLDRDRLIMDIFRSYSSKPDRSPLASKLRVLAARLRRQRSTGRSDDNAVQ